ncbi:hypothetical protein ASG39_04550 [Rhizobium sp. Leaf371]|uniref:TetR/AcrR family transcriptional regulator n=1 Tax=Rhizobium sp. Leaf371 TaxID=1736355 RepID=UPI0007123747|nr:TetR family transcriptional regulator [Rhizobium sp. Leaf371]KQS72995.1 hypothetical protein ASG39_04550 [Rhizobium sp. Leaf371]
MVVNACNESVKAGGNDLSDLATALIGFETRYAEASRQAAEARAKKAPLGAVHPAMIDPHSFAARRRQEAIELRRAVRDRLESGYKLPFDQHIAGRWRRAFVEDGLRSEDDPVLKLFVTLVPKGGKARASNDKATLDVQSRSKLLTLDYPYVELNKEFLGAIRIDCDGVFMSPEHLLHALGELVREGQVPCLPHVIVGDLLDDGTYRRPHLIFLLPPGTAVWKSEDRRCRRDIVRLFLGVSNGLTKALLSIGADPGAPATTMRMKNPLSPIWHTLTPNRHTMPTLSEYANWVDTGSSREALVRKAAAIQSGMSLKTSNIAFNTLRERAVALLIEWHFAADVRMKGSTAALADHLHVALEGFARTMELDDPRLSYVIAKVADRLAMDFDPVKLQGKKNRQRLLHVTEGMKDVRDRQRAGAEYSQGVRRERSLEKLIKAYSDIVERSETVSVEKLASRAGVSRATAYQHFDTCQQICLGRCIDKKLGVATPDTNLNQLPCSTVEMEIPAPTAIVDGDQQPAPMTGALVMQGHLNPIEKRTVGGEAQKGQFRSRQMPSESLEVSDIVSSAQPYLAGLQTANSGAQ